MKIIAVISTLNWANQHPNLWRNPLHKIKIRTDFFLRKDPLSARCYRQTISSTMHFRASKKKINDLTYFYSIYGITFIISGSISRHRIVSEFQCTETLRQCTVQYIWIGFSQTHPRTAGEIGAHFRACIMLWKLTCNRFNADLWKIYNRKFLPNFKCIILFIKLLLLRISMIILIVNLCILPICCNLPILFINSTKVNL